MVTLSSIKLILRNKCHCPNSYPFIPSSLIINRVALSVKSLNNKETLQNCNERLNWTSEWIPYNQFSYIKEISKSSHSTVYSADDPLYFVDNKNKWSNRPYDLQKNIIEFLSKV